METDRDMHDGKDFELIYKETAALPTPRISELVLQTAKYLKMREWYKAVIGLSWSINNEAEPSDSRVRYADSPKQVRATDVRACFMVLDPSPSNGQVLALFELPELSYGPTRDPGLNHFQFRHANVPALLERVQILMESGIVAHRAANHGPITSFYFCDPDMNVVELCSSNFDTVEEMMAFVQSDEFRRNPSGIEFDPHMFIDRYRAGEPVKQLLATK